jgi:hypothetical protein
MRNAARGCFCAVQQQGRLRDAEQRADFRGNARRFDALPFAREQLTTKRFVVEREQLAVVRKIDGRVGRGPRQRWRGEAHGARGPF